MIFHVRQLDPLGPLHRNRTVQRSFASKHLDLGRHLKSKPSFRF